MESHLVMSEQQTTIIEPQRTEELYQKLQMRSDSDSDEEQITQYGLTKIPPHTAFPCQILITLIVNSK